MKAEDLIAMAAARGVDLEQAAKSSAKLPPKKSKLLPPPPNRVTGRESRVFVKPEYTVAELGHAAQGVPKVCFQAACYAFAGDRSCYWPLHAAIHQNAVLLANEWRWPVNARNVHGLMEPYLQTLAKLVLDEDANPEYFRQVPEVYPIYMHVEERTWENEIAQRFVDVRAIWTDWLYTAARMIQRKLADHQG